MKKIVKIAVIAVVVILAIALIAPAALRGKIADIVKREANAMLAGWISRNSTSACCAISPTLRWN